MLPNSKWLWAMSNTKNKIFKKPNTKRSQKYFFKNLKAQWLTWKAQPSTSPTHTRLPKGISRFKTSSRLGSPLPSAASRQRPFENAAEARRTDGRASHQLTGTPATLQAQPAFPSLDQHPMASFCSLPDGLIFPPSSPIPSFWVIKLG